MWERGCGGRTVGGGTAWGFATWRGWIWGEMGRGTARGVETWWGWVWGQEESRGR